MQEKYCPFMQGVMLYRCIRDECALFNVITGNCAILDISLSLVSLEELEIK